MTDLNKPLFYFIDSTPAVAAIVLVAFGLGVL
jgi:hypothetical protein